MTNSKISFDFDGCLSESFVQLIAKSLIDTGNDVYVLTSRFNDNIFDNDNNFIGYRGVNIDIRDICKRIGIKEENILYTDGAEKYIMYEEHCFDIHFDDMFHEVELIRNIGGNSLLVNFNLHKTTNDIENGNRL